MSEKNLGTEIRNRVIMDLLANPVTLGPILGGLTTSMVSWAFGSALGVFGGLAGFLVGAGILFTKFVFQLESVTQKAYEDLQQEKEKTFNDSLDRLDALLCKDKDPRPENCLRELRILHADLKQELKLKPYNGEIVSNFEKLFDTCVKSLEETHRLWEAGRKLSSTEKRRIQDQREEIVVEIEQMTVQLAGDIRQFKTEVIDSTKNSVLKEELNEFKTNLRVARKTHERMNEFKKNTNFDKE